MATFTNTKTGETVTSSLTNAEAAAKFSERYGSDHWIWFWVHKYTQDELVHSSFIEDMFVLAVGYGLKRPMVRAHFLGRRFKFYLSQRGTLCLKSGKLVEGTNDPDGDEEYCGCFLNGRFVVARERTLPSTAAMFLSMLEADAVGFLAVCSKDMDRCCYCGSPLEDPRSKDVGYGPVCARRWGLAWGTGSDRAEKAPSFSKFYGPQAAGFCDSIRADPADHTNWLVFADWLEERGLPRVHPPASGARMPRRT